LCLSRAADPAYIGGMALLKIARMGHPVLARPAAAVEDPTAAELRRLVGDMVETLFDADGIGLAAPQVYQPLRLILFFDGDEREAARNRPPMVLINPELEPLDDAIEQGFEGCLSMPGLRGIVPRHAHIGYRGVGLDGRAIEREARGLHARVVQHEVDHLDGVLFPMRMTDLRQLTFESELRHFAAALSTAPSADAEDDH
jgi:peptide deformylase